MSGYVIKQFRESNGFSQEDLARVLNVNRRTVSRWEQNSSKPNPDELKRLSTLIGVAEEEILSNKDPGVLSSEETGHMILNRISDGVDNLVTGQEMINESIVNSHDEYRRKQDELICVLKEQNQRLVSKIDGQSKIIEAYKNAMNLREIELRHKRVRTLCIVVTCLVVLGIVIGTLIYILNNGFSNSDFVKGSVVLAGPEYYEVDD